MPIRHWFDLWLISSNGAITRSFMARISIGSVAGKLAASCGSMREFRNTVSLRGNRSALVLERLDELTVAFSAGWKRTCSTSISYLEDGGHNPVQTMFCGPIAACRKL
jgi:hypothetical protein